MTTANELVTELRYRVNEAGLKQYLGQVRRAAGVGKSAAQGVALGIRDQAREWRTAIAAQRAQMAATRQQKSANEDMFGAWKSRLQQVLAMLGATRAAQSADVWSGVRSRVSLEVDKTEVQATLDQIFATAQNTQQAYSAVADMYLPIVRNRKELELTNDQSLRLTETISKLIAIGGGEAGANAAALTQLGQALGSGVLRGDELNSIMEQAPKLAQGIAEAMGVTVGQLREMGKAGKITAKALSQGLLKQSEKVDGEFAQMASTFSGATQVIVNGLERQIDKWNRMTGAADKFAKLARVVGDNIGHAMNFALFAGAILGLSKLRALLWTINFAALRLAAVLAGVYLVLDDVAGWASGKDSLLGSLIGDASEWQGVIQPVKDFIAWVRDAVGDSSSSVGEFLSKWGAVALAVLGVWKILKTVLSVLAIFASWPMAIAAAIIATTVVIYRYWDDIVDYFSTGWNTITNRIESAWQRGLQSMREAWRSFVDGIVQMAPEWLRNGASWVGQTLGISSSQAAAPRGGAAAGPTENNFEINVTAPSSDPAAVANATGGAVRSAAAGMTRGAGRRRALPTVEAAS